MTLLGPNPSQPAVTLEALYFGPIAAKVEVAATLLRSCAHLVMQDAACATLVAELAAATQALQSLLSTSGMTAQCAACGRRADGGCCGAWVADQSDAMLLFVNGLLGWQPAALPDRRPTCAFLGPSGCSLRVKPFLCQDYDCHALSAMIDGADGPGIRHLRAACAAHYLALEQRTLSVLGQAGWLAGG
jgi:hypothetical protein